MAVAATNYACIEEEYAPSINLYAISLVYWFYWPAKVYFFNIFVIRHKGGHRPSSLCDDPLDIAVECFINRNM